MFTTRSVVLIFSAAMIVLGSSVVSSQPFPSKPIRIYTGGPGSSNDLAARLVAGGISGPLGQPVIIENRGSTTIAAPIVAQSPPDGYSLALAGDQLWLGPLLRGQTDAIKDYSPVSMLASAPNILGVHPSLPVKSVKELIVLAKARPGELNYGTSAAGGVDHIAGEWFKSMTGVNIVRVPFKGVGPALTALMGGELQVLFGSMVFMTTGIKSGKVRGLAVTSVQPTALFPSLPTMAGAGLPGYEIIGIDALYAAAKTPPAIINRLNQEIVRFLKTPEAKEKYLVLGAEIIASSPEEHAAKIQSRLATYGKVIKDAGITAD